MTNTWFVSGLYALIWLVAFFVLVPLLNYWSDRREVKRTMLELARNDFPLMLPHEFMGSKSIKHLARERDRSVPFNEWIEITLRLLATEELAEKSLHKKTVRALRSEFPKGLNTHYVERRVIDLMSDPCWYLKELEVEDQRISGAKLDPS